MQPVLPHLPLQHTSPTGTVQSKKEGNLILTKSQVKAVHHLNAFIMGRENGTTFLQNHTTTAFAVRAFTRLFASTGIGYVAMLSGAAFVDKVDKMHAASQNKDIKNNQAKVLQLFTNHIARELRPEKTTSIAGAKDLQAVLKNDEYINTAIKALIESVNVKIGTSSLEDTLKKYEDAINYFVKKAKKQDFPEIVINDAKAYLSQSYCEALTERLGNEFAKKLPSKEEFDCKSGKLFSFIKENINTTEAVVKNNILLATRKKMGAETIETLHNELLKASASLDSDDHPQVKDKLNELKLYKGTSKFDGIPEEGSLEAKLQTHLKTLSLLEETLVEKNSQSLAFLVAAHYTDTIVTPATLAQAQASPGSQETNKMLDDAFSTPFKAEQQKDYKYLFDVLGERASLRSEIKTQQEAINKLQFEIHDLHEKIIQPHHFDIKQELKQPIESQINVLKMISDALDINLNTRLRSEEPSFIETPSHIDLSARTEARVVEKILEDIFTPEVDDRNLQQRIAALSGNGKRVYDLIIEQALKDGVQIPDWDKQYAFSHAYPSFRDDEFEGRPVVNNRNALIRALEAYANELNSL